MQENREEPQRSKQILFIIAIYLILTISSHITSKPEPFSQNIVSIINNPEAPPPFPKTLLNLFRVEKYEGTWKCSKDDCFLSESEGKASMTFIRFGTIENAQYQVKFIINNGRYIDNGKAIISFNMRANKLISSRSSTTVLMTLVEEEKGASKEINETVYFSFIHELKLQTISERLEKLDSLTLNITCSSESKTPNINFHISNTDMKLELDIKIEKEESKNVSTVIFAILLFVISYMEFSSIMQMIRGILEGSEDPSHYSIVTMLMASMWDAVICVVTFALAFENEESLVLFIMPAFMLCLLFTNLELRILLLIFQSKFQSANQREIVCSFNLTTFGSMILIYPILLYTNLGSGFFIIISLIFVPQIYENAKLGKRPNVTSAYYSTFLPLRYLIILYLKCFPWNVFELEPNYLLGFICLTFLVLQIILLWVQKMHGPKTVIPSFLLPPVYNYACEIEMNVEEGTDEGECAICLMELVCEVDNDGNKLNVPFRVMRGPCGHKFHGVCLSQWMQIKMECPQCRSKFPPFE